MEDIKKAVEYFKQGKVFVVPKLELIEHLKHINVLRDLAERVIEIEGKMPQKKPVNKHEDHLYDIDEEFCVRCMTSIWDEGEIPLGNSKYNQALDDCILAMAGQLKDKT